MSDPLFDPEDDTATPLEAEEREQLIPTYITVRTELNEVEQINIANADRWAFARKRDVLDVGFLRSLHKRMFGDVWRWAGEYRTTARNIGIEAYRINAEIVTLIDDVKFWIEAKTYDPDEIAVRYHHRLVAIHPFPNGNGRHGRMAADLLARQIGRERFTWGSHSDETLAQTRDRYVAALRVADGYDIAPLLKFARS